MADAAALDDGCPSLDHKYLETYDVPSSLIYDRLLNVVTVSARNSTPCKKLNEHCGAPEVT
jgi:hypothetical protein